MRTTRSCSLGEGMVSEGVYPTPLMPYLLDGTWDQERTWHQRYPTFYPTPVERMAHTWENITFPQLRWRQAKTGNNIVQNLLKKYITLKKTDKTYNLIRALDYHSMN